MSIGDAQLHEITMDDQPLFKLYHYDTGTSNAKAIWSDAAKTTPLAQPAVADANGFLSFYADGVYRMVFKNSSDVAIDNMDLDPWQITADMATTFELNQGTILPSAAAANKGHGFLLLDVSDNILGLYISDGTQYKAMAKFTAAGNQVFDSVLTNGVPVHDVTHPDYGALADGSDDSPRIQLAINAIQSAGTGVLYFPAGTYTLQSALTVANCHIWVKGDGSGQSFILQTGGAGTNGFTITQSSVNFQVMYSDITVRTNSVNSASGTAISIDWTGSSSIVRNFILKDVVIDSQTPGTNYWFYGLQLDDTLNATINGLKFAGKDLTVVAQSAIQLLSASGNINIDNCTLSYAVNGIDLQNTVDSVSINGTYVDHVTTGISCNSSSATSNYRIQECLISAFETGILSAKVVRGSISGNIIYKDADSTSDFRGIYLSDTCNDSNVTDNSVIDGASVTGTFTGIDITNSTGGLVHDNYIKGDSSSSLIGINLASNSSEIVCHDNYGKDITTLTVNASTTNIVYSNHPASSSSIPSFASGDTTPSVKNSSGGNGFFITANAGATSITGFDDAYRGETIIVRANDANTTLVHSSSLKLGSSINYAMANGDTITLFKENTGSWNELGRRIV